ncbi:hypothetical protein L3X38_042682 [Prunus dulcis]|uniref:Uncharacterized protein n=1 Tax=Prunus dulcis TaxID=3755 RepID=A0AAD4YLF9_PRUDU|nr:hypothetical protein L3X38_042682 [Prunus dulcis]
MLNIMKTKTLLMDMMVMKKMGNMISWMLNEEFGKVEEELEVESDEAEQGGEDEEEDGDFIDSEFEKSDEEDNMNFHRYVVTEEQDDGHKEPGEGDIDGYNTSDLESLHEDSEDEDGKKRGLRQPKFK